MIGHRVVVHLAQRRQIEFGVGVALLGAAQRQDQFPWLVSCAGRRCCRPINFSAKYALTVALRSGLPPGYCTQAPSDVSLLHAQVVGDLGKPRIIFLFDDEFQQDIFALKDGVSLEFSAPESGRILHGNQALRSLRQCFADLFGRIVFAAGGGVQNTGRRICVSGRMLFRRIFIFLFGVHTCDVSC